MRRNQLLVVVAGTLQIYVEKNVSRVAAALSYFLMLSIFPALICLYEMLGNLFPAPETVISFSRGFLPENALDVITDYLEYIARNHSRTMLLMALTATVTTASAAFRTIDYIMGEIRGKKRYPGPLAFLFSLVSALVFLSAIYFSIIVIVTGSWFIRMIDTWIPVFRIAESWAWCRFLLLFFLLFVILLGIYRATAPKNGNVRVLAGAVFASAALVGISILFSFIISKSVKYSLLYGSLASVMILLLWMYICGNIVICGNILNVMLERYNAGNEKARPW